MKGIIINFIEKYNIKKGAFLIVVIQIICGNLEQNGTYIRLVPIPNTTNSIFEYNQYVGEPEIDSYQIKYAIVSEKERQTILNHWNEFQLENEIQFEKDYMASIAARRKYEQEKNEEEEEE